MEEHIPLENTKYQRKRHFMPLETIEQALKLRHPLHPGPSQMLGKILLNL